MKIKTQTRQTLELLRDYESRNVTFIERDFSWPIVWERARGFHVWDAEGSKYLDLTAAFGVAAAGHANRQVVTAGQLQMAKLLHAMGDVHPHRLKAQLARELSRLTFERWTAPRFQVFPQSGKTLFCNSGFEAVEAALKTAILATNKPGIIAFTGGYHGTGYGALNATHRRHFRAPFRRQLGEFGHFVAFPRSSADMHRTQARITRLLRREKIGAILVEPIQVRGGINIPPDGFLAGLRRNCDEHHALLIVDEIYTGFGRTGKWFACEHAQTIPDIICLGKALTGGFPLSAAVGRADLMDAAWPNSSGEAIHTSTFLGHPVGCAMALAQMREIARLDLITRSERLGRSLLAMLTSEMRMPGWQFSVRGLGLLAGIELCDANARPATRIALQAIKEMLKRGFILLPEGEHGNVISFTPPLTISKRALHGAVTALAEVLGNLSRKNAR